jgi:hypothetical protein
MVAGCLHLGETQSFGHREYILCVAIISVISVTHVLVNTVMNRRFLKRHEISDYLTDSFLTINVRVELLLVIHKNKWKRLLAIRCFTSMDQWSLEYGKIILANKVIISKENLHLKWTSICWFQISIQQIFHHVTVLCTGFWAKTMLYFPFIFLFSVFLQFLSTIRWKSFIF